MTKTKKITLWTLGIVAGVIITALITWGLIYLRIWAAITSKCYEPDIVIENPSGDGTLTIREWGYYFSTQADIFYKENGFLKIERQIGTTSNASETYFPFKSGNYTVTWGEDTVTLEYDNGKEWVSKTFELP